MRIAPLRVSRLLFVAFTLEMSLGLGIYAFPNEFAAPQYATLRPYFPYLSAALVAGGVVLLLLVRYLIPRSIQSLLALIPAAPMALISYHLLEGGLRVGPIVYGLLTLALGVAPALAEGPEESADSRGRDLFEMTLGLIIGAIGLFMLLSPQSFPLPAYRAIKPALPLIGLGGMAGAVALLSSWRLEWLRRLAGVILPAGILYNSWSAGLVIGVIAWATFAGALLAGNPSRGLRPVPLRQIQGPTDVAALERALELWSWLVCLIALLISSLSSPNESQSLLRVNLFVLFIGGYNAVAHWLFPRDGTASARLLFQLAFMAITVAAFLPDHGRVDGIRMLLAIPPMLAARSMGSKAGYWLLAIVLPMANLPEVIGWSHTGFPTSLGGWASELLVQTLLVSLAGLVGVRSAASEHHLQRSLSRAGSELQRQVDQMALLNQISSAVRSSLDLDVILSTAVAELGEAMRVSRCNIRLREGDVLPVTHTYCAPGAPLPPQDELVCVPVRLPGGEPWKGMAVCDVVGDERVEPTFREALRAAGVRGLLAAPFLADGDLVGLVSFHQCDGPRDWTRGEIEFVEAAASQIAVAIVQARTHRALAERHSELLAAHERLQAQGEQLQAQQEEMHAQFDELLSHRELLTLQHEQLRTALQAARSAEDARDRMNAMLEATSDLVAIFDANAVPLWMNSACRAALGVSDHEDISQLQLTDYVTPASMALIEHVAKPALRETGRFSGEITVVSRDGRQLPAWQVLLAHKGTDGALAFYSTILRDTSERKQAEAAMRESESRFRTVFGEAPIGMGLTSRDGRWLLVNRSLCGILGYSEEELVGTGFRDITHPDDLGATNLHLEQLLAGESGGCHFEKRYIHKLGHVIWALLSVSVVRHPDGKVAYFIAHVQDITDRKRSEAQLIHLANYDPLTGLYNRRRFNEELERELAASHRYGTCGALLFLDLDQFKYVNDTLGHQAGDELLREIALILQQRLRRSDTIGRLGGDEFALILPHSSREQAQSLAEDILEMVRRQITVVAGQPVTVTASIGCAMFPEHGASGDDLLARADVAMYHVKERGRNGFHFYTPDHDRQTQMESKITWERRIQAALEHDRFILHFQPIMDLHSGEIAQYELLIRMLGDEGEIIPPGAFLHVAERFGLIHAIDRWVVRKAIRLIADYEQRGRRLQLEVNLSGKAFSDQELMPLIQRELRKTGIDPSCLVLEITETAAINDTHMARTFVETLEGLGCKFAIDDFGAGFSSFYYLKHLPVDYLKIDGSFIRNLTQDPVDQHMVRAIVELARGLGKKTIAEFVGDDQTVQLLQEYGVDFAQGYHIGKPGTLEELLRA